MVKAPFQKESAVVPGKQRKSKRLLFPIVVGLLIVALVFSIWRLGPGRSVGCGGFAVGETSGHYFSVDGNTLTCVLWIDEHRPGGSSGTSSNPMGFRGEYVLEDGREVAWNCVPRDSKAGRIEIAGLPYRLENGGLFLITTKVGGIKVEQLPIETLRAAGGKPEEVIKVAAETEPRLMAFVNPPTDR